MTLTVSEVKDLINEAVTEALKNERTRPSGPEVKEPRFMDMEAARNYLSKNGLNYTKASLYCLVCDGRLSRHKIGKKNLFTREDLDRFINTSVWEPVDKSDAVLNLAAAANKRK